MGSTSYMNEYRSLLMLILDLEDQVEESKYALDLIKKATTKEPELGVEALSKDAADAINLAIRHISKYYSFSNSKDLEHIARSLRSDVDTYQMVLNGLYDNLTEPLRLMYADEDLDTVDKYGNPTWLRDHLDSSKNADAHRRRDCYRKHLSPTSDILNPIRLEALFAQADDDARAAFLT